jgi:hypothetical protein
MTGYEKKHVKIAACAPQISFHPFSRRGFAVAWKTPLTK